MIAQIGRLLLGAMAAAAVAGCGAAPSAADPPPAAPGPAASSPAPPTAPGPPARPEPSAATPPWPARSAAEAIGLQQTVEAGSQPWLLDPTEVALSYVAAAHGWDSATAEEAAPPADGTASVAVTGPGGVVRRLDLHQPATEGPGGIWTVGSDTPAAG